MGSRDTHIIGVFVYGALAIAGAMLLGFMAQSEWAVALAIASAGFAWLAQNWNAAELYSFGRWTAFLSALSAGASMAVALFGGS